MSLKKQSLLLLAGLALAGVALPQKKDAPKPPQQPPPLAPVAKEPAAQATPTHVSLAELMGADVVLDTGAAEKPAEKSGEKAGEKSGGAADAAKGKVAELVVSTHDGAIACAALSVGKIVGQEKIVLVPMTAVRATMVDKRPAYVLHMTKTELEALPPFEIRKAEAEGLERAVEQARGLGGGAAPGKGKAEGHDADDGMGPGAAPGAAGKGAAKAAVPEYVLSGQLKTCSVDASDKEFGKVQDAAVDLNTNAVGYLVVSRAEASGGAGLTIVPFRACQWTHAENKDALKLGKSLEQLKGAPEYKKPEKGVVTAEQMRSADGFFGGKAGAVNPQ